MGTPQSTVMDDALAQELSERRADVFSQRRGDHLLQRGLERRAPHSSRGASVDPPAPERDVPVTRSCAVPPRLRPGRLSTRPR